jgi:phage shock protein PspC (stress-responsive transcriptional regulator)
MICPRCQKEIADSSNFCYFCGERMAPAAQAGVPPQGAPAPGTSAGYAEPRRLTRSVTDRKLGGVCAGLAHYLDMDVSLVRVLAVCSVVFYGVGFFAYLVAWLVIPEGDSTAVPAPPSRRLHRSQTDRRIGGVCGGMAEYLEADPTIIRLIWAVSFFVFGIGGVLYLLLWFILPVDRPQAAGMQTAG